MSSLENAELKLSFFFFQAKCRENEFQQVNFKGLSSLAIGDNAVYMLYFKWLD
jgi:hypothetical protein